MGTQWQCECGQEGHGGDTRHRCSGSTAVLSPLLLGFIGALIGCVIMRYC